MPTARRRRTIALSPEDVWAIVADPHHLPRWWPGVKRVEGVSDDRFTQVIFTKKGRPIRVDFRRRDSQRPSFESWEQEIEGTPFQRVLAESVIEVSIEPEGAGSRVTIEQRQQLKGYSRTGGLMLRRATRTRLDEALAGLQAISGPPPS